MRAWRSATARSIRSEMLFRRSSMCRSEPMSSSMPAPIIYSRVRKVNPAQWARKVTVSALLVFAAACSSSSNPVAEKSQPRSVQYAITGTHQGINVTFQTSTGQQQQTVATGWHHTETLDGASAAVLVAQARLGGTITCTITDQTTNALLASNTSTGAHAVVTCHG